MLRAARQRGFRGSVEEAGELAELAPDAVVRAVLVRLDALPAEAGALARAAAVLGPDSRLEQGARLAELSDSEAAGAADALAAAHVLAADRELRFVHPIVRTAVEESMAPSQRRRSHAEAARVLAESGAGSERLTAHLLLADPAGDAGVVRYPARGGGPRAEPRRGPGGAPIPGAGAGGAAEPAPGPRS